MKAIIRIAEKNEGNRIGMERNGIVFYGILKKRTYNVIILPEKSKVELSYR